MVGSVQSSVSAVDIQQLLASAVAQIIEDSAQAALLNLSQLSGNPAGVGENLDIVA